MHRARAHAAAGPEAKGPAWPCMQHARERAQAIAPGPRASEPGHSLTAALRLFSSFFFFYLFLLNKYLLIFINLYN
jgi:hypothetical protein